MTKKDTIDIESLVNLEVMTIKQAQVYVEEKTGMRSSSFYDCVGPFYIQSPLQRTSGQTGRLTW
jgi:hypothetical protein